MKHRRGIDLAQDDMFDEATGTVAGWSIYDLFAASEAAKHLRFAHIPPAWMVGSKCRHCGHMKMLDRWELEERVGKQALVIETGRRLRCSRCRVRGCSWFQFVRQPR